MKRNEFIKIGCRFLILGGMTAAAGYLAIKRKVDVTCSVSPVCRQCRWFSECELPLANEHRQKEAKDGK